MLVPPHVGDGSLYRLYIDVALSGGTCGCRGRTAFDEQMFAREQ